MREDELRISERVRPRYETRNDEIVAGIREASGADAPLNPEEAVKRNAAEIAVAMALLHGGEWRVQIEAGFVHVTRRLGYSRR